MTVLINDESFQAKMKYNQQDQKPEPTPNYNPHINTTDNDDAQIMYDTNCYPSNTSKNVCTYVTQRLPSPNAVKIVADSVTEQLEQLNTNSKFLLLLVMVFAVIVLIAGLILLGFGLYDIYDPEFALLKLFLAIINPVIIGYQLSLLVNTYLWFCDRFCCVQHTHLNTDVAADKIDCQTLITWLVFCAGTIIVLIMQLYIYSFVFDAVLLMVAFVLETMLKVLENEQQINQQKHLKRWQYQLTRYYLLPHQQQDQIRSYTTPRAMCTLDNSIMPQTTDLNYKNSYQSQSQFEFKSEFEDIDELKQETRMDRAKQRIKSLSPRLKNKLPSMSLALPLTRSMSDSYSKHLENVIEMATVHVRKELTRSKSDTDKQVNVRRVNSCVIKDDTNTYLLRK